MRRPLAEIAPLLALAAGAFALVPDAGAIDSLRKRITVDFGDVPCMTRVDRSVDAMVPITWTVAEEEVYEIPPDEVEGGRTHQLVAIARQEAKQLPTWMNQGDVDATAAKIPDFGMPMPTDIFEASPDWPAPMWTRVTPDDPRIEITHQAAAAGATWDTSGLPVGVYQLLGYTYDPPVNVHSRREGLFKVVDGDVDGPPAMYIEPKEIFVTKEGTQLDLDACVDAAAGSTLSAYIGEVVVSAGAIDWQAVDLEAGAVPSRGSLALGIDIPFGSGGEPLRIYRVRLDIEDPSGASYTAYSPLVYQVSTDPDAPDDSETSGGGNEGGGTCSANRTTDPSQLLWLGMLLLALRRRRPSTASTSTEV